MFIQQFTPNYIYNPIVLYSITPNLQGQKKEEKSIKEPKKNELVSVQKRMALVPSVQPMVASTIDSTNKEDETKKKVLECLE